jgi:hypothetical protein
MARTAAAKARMAQPSRLNEDRMVAVFMRNHLPPDLAPPSGCRLAPGFGTSLSW